MIRIIDAPDAAPTLFPEPDLQSLLGYVRTVWENQRTLQPTWWVAKKETVLVAGLFHALNNDESLMQHGVGFGHLVYERTDIELDLQGMPKHRGRTDILFYHASHMGPGLVFEFKRLDNKGTLRGKYVKEGVSRFVSGKYAETSDFGMMVGLVAGSMLNEQTALTAYLSKASVVSDLMSATIAPAAYWAPSEYAPAVNFDTFHNRPAGCPQPTIRVGHMLLER